ncbi:MAG: type I DNA topoisomerase [Dehalococcoidales bacterium]|nr:type I DNA topoisomerase [Dehalococcoidales bacterium]
MKKNLVIVESPAKAKTLSRILGKEYNLKASMGHVRDLPKGAIGVDIENSFAPKYVVPRTKSKLVKELKEAAKTAAAVYLATDPDREGEAIAWHLSEVTRSDRKPYHRVVFHEITEEAIRHAFKQPRSIDLELVNAQQARRIMDRLVGYKISPLLWKKVRRGLSAGRVQSVALRIIVEREREIDKFTPQEYWTIEAELATETPVDATVRASLVGLGDGIRLEIHNLKEADCICDELREARYRVGGVRTKKVSRRPAPPFITSTLQQEAWRRFRFSAKQTMSIAQQLYEGLAVGSEGSVGLITYMRTDSTRVARSAVVEAREFINSRYGPEFVPAHARSFTKAVKGAQEAHEAIRPTRIGREPSLLQPYLNKMQLKLYQLIWQRMLASQMSDAIFDNTSIEIEAIRPYDSGKYILKASSSVIKFPGFMSLYIAGKDEDEDEGEEAKKSPLLPHLERGDKLTLIDLFPEQRFTQPPPRFTEASLIKVLEQNGIGRPSTYATILSTILDREYINKTKGSLQPTELGSIVNDQLTRHFASIINVEFTARMEEELDEIGNRKRGWVDVLNDFYGPFDTSLKSAAALMEKVKIVDEQTEETCPRCGKPLVVKYGRYGKFLSCSGYPECKYTRSYEIKTGVNCPQPGCTGSIVEKINKKKRTFYGCNRWPECDFAINARPIPHPCPKCGGLLTLYRRKQTKCTKCDYKGKLEE